MECDSKNVEGILRGNSSCAYWSISQWQPFKKWHVLACLTRWPNIMSVLITWMWIYTECSWNLREGNRRPVMPNFHCRIPAVLFYHYECDPEYISISWNHENQFLYCVIIIKNDGGNDSSMSRPSHKNQTSTCPSYSAAPSAPQSGFCCQKLALAVWVPTPGIRWPPY